MGSLHHALWVLLLALVMSGPVSAQPLVRPPVTSPILTIDSDQLFEESDYGRKTIEAFEKMGMALSAENRVIEETLGAEEKKLTELRPTLDPVDFRVLADAFDAKVQETRRAQDTKTRELSIGLENSRVVFLNAAVPVLEQIMREAEAMVVLERRTVFISSNAIDITRLAIERLNASLDAPQIAPLDD